MLVRSTDHPPRSPRLSSTGWMERFLCSFSFHATPFDTFGGWIICRGSNKTADFLVSLFYFTHLPSRHSFRPHSIRWILQWRANRAATPSGFIFTLSSPLGCVGSTVRSGRWDTDTAHSRRKGYREVLASERHGAWTANWENYEILRRT